MAKFEETGAAVGAMLPVTPVSEVLTMLNKESGVLGISGLSNDYRA